MFFLVILSIFVPTSSHFFGLVVFIFYSLHVGFCKIVACCSHNHNASYWRCISGCSCCFFGVTGFCAICCIVFFSTNKFSNKSIPVFWVVWAFFFVLYAFILYKRFFTKTLARAEQTQ